MDGGEFLMQSRLRGLPIEWPSDDRQVAPTNGVMSSSLEGLELPELPVAVVIPCHNYGHFLGGCLESILTQRLRPSEIVVVDDDSNDNSAQIAADYSDRGVRLVQVSVQNPHEARAVGYRHTTSPLLCFVDADDQLDPEYLATAIPFFADPEVGIAYSPIHEFGERCRRWNPSEANIEFHNWIHAGSVVRRRALDESRAFETPNDNSKEDWELWRRVLRSGWQTARNPTPYYYRRHAGSRSDVQRTRAKICPILSSYFTAAPDPQRRVLIPPDDNDKIAGWAEGIRRFGLSGVIFHNNLSRAFRSRWSGYGIEFIQVAPPPPYMHNNVWRFECYREWLEANQPEAAFLTDLFDVLIARSPLTLLDMPYDLWLSIEPTMHGDGSNGSRWVGQRLRRTYGEEVSWLEGKPILNAGVLGGRLPALLRLLARMRRHFGTQFLLDMASDMAIFNVIGHSTESDRVWIQGAPLHSEFKAFQTDRDDVVFIHK